MAEKSISVTGYERTSKTGKTVHVDPYRQTRDIGQDLLRAFPGRPAVAAKGGAFPGGRSIPDQQKPLPDVKKVRATAAKAKAEQKRAADRQARTSGRRKQAAIGHLEKRGFQVEHHDAKTQKALDTLRAHGVKAKPPKATGNRAVRPDDKRTGQGQTRTNFVNETTGAPMGKTETGDTFEQMFIAKGKDLVEKKYGKFSLVTGAGSGTSRTTPLDLRTATHGGELKSISALSPNQKTAIKKEEIARKLEAVGNENLKPLLLVQVIDQANHKVHLFGMEQFASKSINSMEKYGSYDYSPEDFRAAQEAAGHASKAIDRAVQQLDPAQKKAYARYIEAGMTPEEALAQVRNHHGAFERPAALTQAEVIAEAKALLLYLSA